MKDVDKEGALGEVARLVKELLDDAARADEVFDHREGSVVHVMLRGRGFSRTLSTWSGPALERFVPTEKYVIPKNAKPGFAFRAKHLRRVK